MPVRKRDCSTVIYPYSVINYRQMDKLINGLDADKVEKLYETGVSGDDTLKLTSIPRNSPTGKGLGEMVRSGKQSMPIGGVQVINGLMLSQFELQASQGTL